jgi:hypothetical protein
MMKQMQTGPYLLQSTVVTAIKEMRDKNATEDHDGPGDALKLLEEDGLKLWTQLSNNIHETGRWPQDFCGYNDCLKEAKKLQNAANIAQSASFHIQQKQ